LLADRRGAGIGADTRPAGSARLADRPGQPGLDRRDFGGQLVSVETQPGLEAQRIAGAEARRRHGVVGEKASGQGLDSGGRHGQLEAILTGVAGAGDVHGQVVKATLQRLQEHQRRGLGKQRREYVARRGPLQGQQPLAVELAQRLAGAQVRLDPGAVLHLAGGIHDQEKLLFRAAGDNQVIANTARVVGQQRVALPVLTEGLKVSRYQGLQRRGDTGPFEQVLPHVRDVEQARLFARVRMLGDDPRRVAHGHVVAREGHHAGTEFAVQAVQRRV
jgi:hypothetical protein